MATRTRWLGRDPQALPSMRRWLAEVLEGVDALDDGARADVLVMASELVTNVLLHTESNPRLTVVEDDGAVLVEVSDDDVAEPAMADRAPGRVGGNGLRIVDAWSSAWGVRRARSGGKTVWFTVGGPRQTSVQRHVVHAPT